MSCCSLGSDKAIGHNCVRWPEKISQEMWTLCLFTSVMAIWALLLWPGWFFEFSRWCPLVITRHDCVSRVYVIQFNFLFLLSQRMSCSYLLCTILLFVAVLLAVTVTGTILFMNHYQAPPLSDGLPHISTNQDEANALVTVERGDGSRINIFIDPNCPDYNSNFLRLEGVQTSLLHSLTDHDSDLKSVKGQDRALLVSLAEEVAKLSAHAEQLKMDYEALRRGQGSLGQDLNTLQTEQGRLIQVRNPQVGVCFMSILWNTHFVPLFLFCWPRLNALWETYLSQVHICYMHNWINRQHDYISRKIGTCLMVWKPGIGCCAGWRFTRTRKQKAPEAHIVGNGTSWRKQGLKSPGALHHKMPAVLCTTWLTAHQKCSFFGPNIK